MIFAFFSNIKNHITNILTLRALTIDKYFNKFHFLFREKNLSNAVITGERETCFFNVRLSKAGKFIIDQIVENKFLTIAIKNFTSSFNPFKLPIILSPDRLQIIQQVYKPKNEN